MRVLVPLTALGLVLAACGSQIAGRAVPASAAATITSSDRSSASSSTAGSPSTPATTPESSASDTGQPPGPFTGKIPRPTPGGNGAGVVPAGLGEYYSQQLAWQTCVPFNDSPDVAKEFTNTALECANLIVPLDYADPAGPTVSIAVLRSKATGAKVGALQMNPGGPGASGLQLVAQIDRDKEWATLHQSFDFVGFDTRGVGGSRPLISCWTDTEADAARAANLRPTSDGGVAKYTQVAADYVAKCVARTGKDAGIDGTTFLLKMGTADTVKDMDVLRSALDEKKMTYLGFSYGTLLGSVYAGQFAGNVRAMILDGAVDPAADPVAQDIGQAVGFQATFDAFAKWCAAQNSCVLGTDPGQATAKFQQITRPLLDHPLDLKDGRVLAYSDGITGTFLALYSEQSWDALRSALKNLTDGDGTLLMALADYYAERGTDGHYGRIMDAYTAVSCLDNAKVPLDNSVVQRYNAAAPFQDSGDPAIAVPSPLFGDQHHFLCSLWPGGPTLVSGPASAPGVAPLVVISTTGDPATPYDDGVTLAKELGAALITVQGNQHTAYLSAGNTCVDNAGTDYLVDLTLPADGLTCS